MYIYFSVCFPLALNAKYSRSFALRSHFFAFENPAPREFFPLLKASSSIPTFSADIVDQKSFDIKVYLLHVLVYFSYNNIIVMPV